MAQFDLNERYPTSSRTEINKDETTRYSEISMFTDIT